ncbi:MAG TPA: amylo-alpha-1,6-glucosidase, partial [Acetobacteraceae bacterium]|nr:amylo-alpha-1,6-glucosidase [Acetobacteraceae bacterium]
MVLRAGDGLAARPAALAARIIAAERFRRAAASSPLALAAESYLADRGAGSTIIAGFPWFTDWGRDTFIAMRGLALGTGKLREAESILLAWSGAVSEGMLPNRFPDSGETPEYNAVDASLWFVVAAHDYFRAAAEAGHAVAPAVRARLRDAVEAILQGHASGTRYGIVADTDGLLRAGEPGVQLTWMDAKLGDWVVTPRVGKPVEVQALWINALRTGAAWAPRWEAPEGQARAAFAARFPDPETGGLVDVVDVDHVPGEVDRRVRPNQVLAVGGLPFPVVEGTAARRVFRQPRPDVPGARLIELHRDVGQAPSCRDHQAGADQIADRAREPDCDGRGSGGVVPLHLRRLVLPDALPEPSAWPS